MASTSQHSVRKLSRRPSLFPAADPRFTVHGSRFTVPLISILLALLCLVSTACSTTNQNSKIIFEDPRGTVSLQTIPNRSIQANHPINLEPALLVQVLKGIEVQNQGDRALQRFVEGPSPPVPVFTEEQIEFLAPLIAEGLRAAAPDQRVAYRSQTSHKGSRFESSTTETTAGSLYAYGRQLFVTLSQYRFNPTRTNVSFSDVSTQRSGVDYSGLKDRILLFTPSAAQRSDSFDPPKGEKPTDRFLAIDYELLQQAWRNLEAKRQAAPQVEGGTVSVGESLDAVRAAEARARADEAQTRAAEAQARNTEALAQEVETLRKQLESIQKQLGNQPTAQDNQNQKTTPQQK